LVVGRLAVSRVRLGNVEIDTLTVRRLHGLETDDAEGPSQDRA
jgi:hypothetical protein